MDLPPESFQTETAYVIVTGAATDYHDTGMQGVHEVRFFKDVPAELKQDVVLEAFHVSVGDFKVIDDFEFLVVDAKGHSFQDQQQDPDIRFEVELARWANGSDKVEMDTPEFEPGSRGDLALAEMKRGMTKGFGG